MVSIMSDKEAERDEIIDETHELQDDESNVQEDKEEIANCVVDLVSDGSLYRKITHNSRKFVEENYDWSIISDKLNKVYMSAL